MIGVFEACFGGVEVFRCVIFSIWLDLSDVSVAKISPSREACRQTSSRISIARIKWAWLPMKFNNVSEI